MFSRLEGGLGEARERYPLLRRQGSLAEET